MMQHISLLKENNYHIEIHCSVRIGFAINYSRRTPKANDWSLFCWFSSAVMMLNMIVTRGKTTASPVHSKPHFTYVIRISTMLIAMITLSFLMILIAPSLQVLLSFKLNPYFPQATALLGLQIYNTTEFTPLFQEYGFIRNYFCLCLRRLDSFYFRFSFSIRTMPPDNQSCHCISNLSAQRHKQIQYKTRLNMMLRFHTHLMILHLTSPQQEVTKDSRWRHATSRLRYNFNW